MKTIVVDYGRGNILSVCRAVEQCGGSVDLATTPEALAAADRLILPGVGAFGDCMAQLVRMGLVEPLKKFIHSERPFLGICVGMQVLFSHSEEFGMHKGLDVIPGSVKAIPKTAADGSKHKTPHIGWTALQPPEGEAEERWHNTLLQGTRAGTPVYFVHSYTCDPDRSSDRLADACYNGRLVSAGVQRGALTGVQFHPEKSGDAGLKLIERFLEI